MGLCKNCKITMCREEREDGIGCAEFAAKDTNVLTNADRIRAMSDEELGRILRVYLRTHALVLNIQTMQSAGYIGSNSLRNKKL